MPLLACEEWVVANRAVCVLLELIRDGFGTSCGTDFLCPISKFTFEPKGISPTFNIMPFSSVEGSFTSVVSTHVVGRGPRLVKRRLLL